MISVTDVSWASYGSKSWARATVGGLPAFRRAKNLMPFITKDLEESTTPIIYEPLGNFGFTGFKGVAFGYRLLVRTPYEAIMVVKNRYWIQSKIDLPAIG